MKKISVWMFGLIGVLWMGASLVLILGFSHPLMKIISEHGDIPTLFWGLAAFSIWSLSLFEIADEQWWTLSALLVSSALFFFYWSISFFSFSL